AVALCDSGTELHPRQATLNAHKVLETYELLGEKPLPRSFARQLLTLRPHFSLEDWLHRIGRNGAEAGHGEEKELHQHAALTRESRQEEIGRRLVSEIERYLEPAKPSDGEDETLPAALTFDQTAKRSFEVTYWKTIARLATGRYMNKDNADCVRD